MNKQGEASPFHVDYLPFPAACVPYHAAAPFAPSLAGQMDVLNKMLATTKQTLVSLPPERTITQGEASAYPVACLPFVATAPSAPS